MMQQDSKQDVRVYTNVSLVRATIELAKVPRGTVIFMMINSKKMTGTAMELIEYIQSLIYTEAKLNGFEGINTEG